MRRNGFQFLWLLFISSLALATHAQDPTRFEAEIQQLLQKKDSLPAPAPILFVGSSTIRMWQGLAEDFPEVPVLNRGFGGSQMSDLLHYAGPLVIAARPRKVFVYEGDNDIADGKSPGRVLRDTRRLLKILGRGLPGIPVVLISAKPSPSRWDKEKKYTRLNHKLAKLCGRREGLAFANIWDVMLDQQGQPRADIFLEDRLHMNRRGYELWAEALRPFL